jgi:hypothetical protein
LRTHILTALLYSIIAGFPRALAKDNSSHLQEIPSFYFESPEVSLPDMKRGRRSCYKESASGKFAKGGLTLFRLTWTGQL